MRAWGRGVIVDDIQKLMACPRGGRRGARICGCMWPVTGGAPSGKVRNGFPLLSALLAF